MDATPRTTSFGGEIANQLGRGDQFKAFWTAGPKAPDEKDWLKLFEGDQPILILLDEMPPYFNYLDTQKVGNGTVADIATRAFACLLTAAGKKKNVCVVVSDLAAAYDTGAKLINRALEDARSELGRQERNITPVDLAANEIYDILRKRLFKLLPDKAEIGDIAEAFGRKLEEAAKSKTAGRGAEAIADEIAATYPFHPRLKNVIALFKENEQFKQTRGLIELVSRLLKSVWERAANDVFLIGPQHFDLSIPDVRDKLTEISGMRDVIAKDLWDAQQSAHAQVIDLQTGKEAATQLGSLLLTASLSTAVNAVKGLTAEEMVECLTTPLREPSDFLAAFEELEKVAWYLHHNEGRYYFDRQENLTKLLQSLAHDAPQNQVDDLVRHRLREMFKPSRKTCYDDVLPLPILEDVADRVRKGRVLLIVSPDSKIPPDEVQKFFDGLSQKNNLCVLTGDKTAMGSVEKAARQHFAAQKADGRIAKGHPQRDDLERKQQAYEQDFNSTILNLFDKVLFPRRPANGDAKLAAVPLSPLRDMKVPFNGEEQIEKSLTAPPAFKLQLDVEKEFDAIRDKAQDLLWPENQDEARWSDMADRYAEQAGMYWLPPKGLDTLKSIACNRGLWEDMGNGYVTKKPKKKKTSAQVIPESEPDDLGSVRLRINAQNAGPVPRIHYAEDSPVSDASPQLKDQLYSTSALRLNLLVADPSGQYETGDPVTWSNKLVLRNKLSDNAGKRNVELFVSPKGNIRYTLDGSEPREGTAYAGPIAIGDKDVLLRAFAEADGLEVKNDFRYPAKGKAGVQIDEIKPCKLVSRTGRKLDSRTKTFEGLKQAAEKSVTFEGIALNVGHGNRVIAINVGEILVDAAFIQALLTKVLEKFDPDTLITMSFRKCHFASGHDLKDFADKLGMELQQGDVEQ